MKISDEKDEILNRIQQMNGLIEKFIHSTLEHIELENLESNPFTDKSLIRKPQCWEIKKCNQPGCPCYNSDVGRCWLAVGSVSENCKGSFAQKYKTCMECEVFKQYSDAPVEALYENINILIQHLINKIKKERELAIRDGLTGIYNRNFLYMIEKGEIKNSILKSPPLSIIVFDLDLLKDINDTYGHIMGDRMLKDLSAFLQKFKRESDLLFRLGGDEFMIVMSKVDETQRKIIEKRLMDALDEWNQTEKEDRPVPLSFSLGGATSAVIEKFDHLISQADKEMYVFKKSRRNKDRRKASDQLTPE